MSFITKNANLLLLLLIVVSAMGLVGATVYFQSNFSKINTQYANKLAELDKVSKNLEERQLLLEKTGAELKLKTARETEIGEKYTVKVAENVNLSETNVALGGEVEALSDSLIRSEQDKQRLEADNLNLQSDNNNLQSQVNRLEVVEDDYYDLQTSYSSLTSQVSGLNSEITCLRTKPDDDEGTC